MGLLSWAYLNQTLNQVLERNRLIAASDEFECVLDFDDVSNLI
jgi:hypothetical protein